MVRDTSEYQGSKHRAIRFIAGENQIFIPIASVRSSSASGRARGRCEPSSSKLHRAKCGNGKQVADDVGSLDASERGGRKSRLEQIAHLLRGSGGDAARIKLFDRFNRGE